MCLNLCLVDFPNEQSGLIFFMMHGLTMSYKGLIFISENAWAPCYRIVSCPYLSWDLLVAHLSGRHMGASSGSDRRHTCNLITGTRSDFFYPLFECTCPIMGRGGLQNGKIVGPKLSAAPSFKTG